MGWGKTTRFIKYLYLTTRKTLYLTYPTIELASVVHEALTDLFNKDTELLAVDAKLGKAIGGHRVEGNVIVQTCGYLKYATDSSINIIDEFHNLHHTEINFISNKKAYENLICMSATPFTPLLANMAKNKEYVEYFGSIPRSNKRFIVKHKLNVRVDKTTCFDTLPDNGVVFGTVPLSDNKDAPIYLQKGLTTNAQTEKSKTSYVAHLSLVIGWSPMHSLNWALVLGRRHIYSTTNVPGVIT